MKVKQIGESFVHFDDGTTWPLTYPSDPDKRGLNWVLRYDDPESVDVLHAAEVVGAYEALIALPQKRRNEVCSAIRAALVQRDSAARSKP